MVRKRHYCIVGFFSLLLATGAYYTQQNKQPKPKQSAAQPRPIAQYTAQQATVGKEFSATGKIVPEAIYRIGSLVDGIVVQLCVAEGDLVQKGQLLAEIDDAKFDLIVRETGARKEGALAEYTYKKNNFIRQQQLYDAQVISRDEYEKAISELEVSRTSYEAAVYHQDVAISIWQHKKIYAPADGVVIARMVSLGEGVSLSSPPSILFSIAASPTALIVEVMVDEEWFDVFNQKTVVAHVEIPSVPEASISTSCFTVSSLLDLEQKDSAKFKVRIPITNEKLHIRPGMRAHVTFTIDPQPGVILPKAACNIAERDICCYASKQGYSISYDAAPEMNPAQDQAVVWEIDENNKTIYPHMCTTQHIDDIQLITKDLDTNTILIYELLGSEGIS